MKDITCSSPQQTWDSVVKFAMLASSFVSTDNFVQLKKTIEKISSHIADLETSGVQLIDSEGNTHFLVKNQDQIFFSKAIRTEYPDYIDDMKDVIELKNNNNATVQSIVNKNKINVNRMFQKVVAVVRNVMIEDNAALFIQSSEELGDLGDILFGTVTVNERANESVVVNIVDGIKTGNLKNFISLNNDRELRFTVDINKLKILRWIEKGTCSISTTIRILHSLTLIIERSHNVTKHNTFNDEDLLKLKEVVKTVKECGAVAMVCRLMASNKRGVAEAATACMLILLTERDVQRRVLRYCKQSEDPIFEWCQQQVSAAILSNVQIHLAKVSLSMGDIDTVTSQMRLAVQCIGALCANQNTELQNYLRVQHNKILSHNFLSLLITLLKYVKKNEMIIDVLVSINEMISGNMESKEYAIEMGTIESLDHLIARVQPEAELCQELDVKSACYTLLSTLMEQLSDHNQIMDLGDKLFDSLNITELQDKVTSHLTDMNNKTYPTNVRRKAAAAAFEGYDVLKNLDLLKETDLGGMKEIEDEIAKDNDLNVENVEVIWKGELKRIYFPKPSQEIREKIKDEMTWNIKRSSQTDKQNDFIAWSHDILKDMRQIKTLQTIPVMQWILKYEKILDWLIFILALVIQIWMVVVWEDFDMTNNTATDSCIKIASYSSITKYSGNVCLPRSYYAGYIAIGILHVLCCVSTVVLYIGTNVHRLDWRLPWNILKEKRLKRSIWSPYHIWLLIIIVCSGLGLWSHGYLFAIHLFHIVTMFDLLTRVVKGAVKNWKQLMVSLLLALIVIYVYAIIWFWTGLRKMFTNSNMEYCGTLWECLVTVGVKSLRPSAGGHNYKWTNYTDFYYVKVRVVLDATFWILYSIITLKVVTALILDGFNTLKNERSAALKDMRNNCTICGLTKDKLASHSIQWERHITIEHSMWSYIKLFYHLQQTRNSGAKLSAVENDVLYEFEHYKSSFLPTKTSMSVKRGEKKSRK